MAIPIPPNLPINPVVDFHRNDLVSPPAAPTVVESLTAIDPRIALKMPLPVVDSSAGGSLQDVLQSAVGRGQPSALLPTEPAVDQAVLLQISSLTGDQAEVIGNPSQARVESLLSQSLARMDTLGGAALGQMLSDILAVDIPELGQTINTGNKNALQSVVVNWPGANSTNANAVVTNTVDPRVVMNVLYQNLQTSGIFAADQLKKLLFPASDDGDMQPKSIGDIPAEVQKLVGQLSSTPALQDSVKLLLRGDLLWQGQLMPNVQGRLYREDAWQSDPQDLTQMQKGSKITMEVMLPNLGPFKVVGTQFGESVHVAIEASPDSQSTLANSFAQLLDQMHSQVDPDAKVSLRGEASS